jgi:hypothetical protein
MIEKVIALCMFLGAELIEHSPKNSMYDCLKTKRIIERNTPEGGNSKVMCGEVEAETYVDKFGIKRIEKIIHSK